MSKLPGLLDNLRLSRTANYFFLWSPDWLIAPIDHSLKCQKSNHTGSCDTGCFFSPNTPQHLQIRTFMGLVRKNRF